MLGQLDIAIGFVVVMLLLSLLITTVVQAVSALLDLRGRNLVWGLTKLFHQISPDFQTTLKKRFKPTIGKELADAVARHPMLSHQFSGRAKAIRPDELMMVLRDLARNPPANLHSDVKAALEAWVAKIAPSPEALAVTNALLAKVEIALPTYAAHFQRIADSTVGAAGRLQAGVEKWFDTAMDRTSDVFVRWTKTITIVAAIGVAVSFHIDAIKIYKQISSDAGIRAKLGAIADQTAKQADDILASDYRGTAAIDSVREKHKDAAASDPDLQTLVRPHNAIVRCSDAHRWLVDQKSSSSLQDEVNQACEEQALSHLQSKTSQDFGTMRAALDSTTLRLNSGPWKWGDWRGAFGVLATVFLLSLGAPFWFNSLRQLSSLKPPIASKIAKEQEQPADVPAPAPTREAKSIAA
jgi:hypothetical protein